MAYVKVYIVAPNGRRYNAEIEDNVGTELILEKLIRNLGLPAKTDDGDPISYRLSFINARKVQEGVTVAITGDKPLPPSHLSSRVSPEDNIIIPDKESVSLSRKVFIVHGHDEEAKQSVARCVEKLGLEAIILHEQPNQGRTIIEKFEDYADVGFAVVLLTPDDIGGAEKDRDSLRPRARQNVILELGFFIGQLGRERVCALHKGNVEVPSDYSGALWVPLDPDGAWRYALAREMKAADLDVDLNRLA